MCLCVGHGVVCGVGVCVCLCTSFVGSVRGLFGLGLCVWTVCVCVVVVVVVVVVVGWSLSVGIPLCFLLGIFAVVQDVHIH